VIDDESLVKTRTNTCLSYTSAVPSYSVTGLAIISQPQGVYTGDFMSPSRQQKKPHLKSQQKLQV
jgi:hypothetical protein